MANSSKLDFNMFVLSLNESALFHLGKSEESEAINLPLAKQSIELLELLEEKTNGNLSGAEERLLCGILQELHEEFKKAQNT